MPALGIDLGTTYSAMAVVPPAGAVVAGVVADHRPVMVPNAVGEVTTPSVVYFDGERPVVGTAARLAATVAPDDCIELVKRQMGDPSWRFVTRAGTTYTAEQVSALILRRLLIDAEASLGGACREAVITVPAYFDDARRRATAQAGVIAGFDVLRVLNEPTAAALAFGHRTVDGVAGRTLLVYDLGGGTFDVTVVELAGDEFRVVATAGDRNLGGFDFDNALMLYVDEQAQRLGAPSSLDGEIAEAVLRDRCEQAKRALSTLPDVVVTVDGTGAQPVRVPVSRAAFERLAAPLLRSTEEILTEVLHEANVRPPDLSTALLVGGSTRMPMVAAMVGRVAGVRTDRSVHPDEAVALGAAICAVELSAARVGTGKSKRKRSPVIHDVTAHSLGVIARSGETGSEINSVVIARNTPLPARGARRFHTLAENQREILIVVTEGEDTDPAYVTVVGSARIPVPAAREPAERIVEVVLGYTAEGLIEVSVADPDSTTGRSLGQFTIDRQAAVDADEVSRMREALHALHID